MKTVNGFAFDDEREVPAEAFVKIDGKLLLVCEGDQFGYVLYSAEEWNGVHQADYEADSDGNIDFQGQPTLHKLSAEAMAAAIP